jgi:inward rectifier potassium channel
MKIRLKKIYRPKHYAKITNREGKLEVEGLDAWYSFWRDPYHLLLIIPWVGFAALVSVGYIVVNIIFALLYLAGGDCLEGAEPGSFLDAFFFSVQTLASIGYGAITPKTTYANIIVTLEAIASLLAIAVVTGLAFARFSKPTARVIFSDVAVVAPYNGVPTLMFRAANKRRNYILEAQVIVDFALDETTKEGELFRRFYELKLKRQRTSSFNLAWTIVHPIDENSPLYGVTPEMLSKDRALIIISLIGTDATVAYTINARHQYSAREILWNYRFADMLTTKPNGDRYLDYRYFHSVVPIEEGVGDRE